MSATYTLTSTWQQMSQASGWSIPPLRTLATWCSPRWRQGSRQCWAKHGTPPSSRTPWPTPLWRAAYSTRQDTWTKTWRRSSIPSIRQQGRRGSTLGSSSARFFPTFIPWTTAQWTRCYTHTVSPTWCPTRFCFHKEEALWGFSSQKSAFKSDKLKALSRCEAISHTCYIYYVLTTAVFAKCLSHIKVWILLLSLRLLPLSVFLPHSVLFSISLPGVKWLAVSRLPLAGWKLSIQKFGQLIYKLRTEKCFREHLTINMFVENVAVFYYTHSFIGWLFDLLNLFSGKTLENKMTNLFSLICFNHCFYSWIPGYNSISQCVLRAEVIKYIFFVSPLFLFLTVAFIRHVFSPFS